MSEEFFSDAIVWNYSDMWRSNDNSLPFEPLNPITNVDGLWVKSEVKKTLEIDKQSSKLHTFKTQKHMINYLTSMSSLSGVSVSYNDLYTTLTPTSGASGGTSEPSVNVGVHNTTSTNLQEKNVNEGDILKHDDENIFVVDETHEMIFITSFENVVANNSAPINTIDMKDKYILSMYLHDNRLTLIYLKKSIHQEKFYIETYDVSNVEDIDLITLQEIDGIYKESRLIDSTLYVVSFFNSNVLYEHPKSYVYYDTICNTLDQAEIFHSCYNKVTKLETGVLPGDNDSSNLGFDQVKYEFICNDGKDYTEWINNQCSQYDYDANGAYKIEYKEAIVSIKQLLPTLKVGADKPFEMIHPNHLYVSNKLNQPLSLSVISSFDTNKGTFIKASAFAGSTHTYYVTTKSIYLVSSQYQNYYSHSNYKEQQKIYKFSLDDNITYQASGFVAGHMLNQFSMSEQGNYLRVATTLRTKLSNQSDFNNSIFILNTIGHELKVEGAVGGLGHKGEKIYAVRFFGEKAFVVTYERKDPLYTIDISNPKKPTVMGELSIPYARVCF